MPRGELSYDFLSAHAHSLLHSHALLHMLCQPQVHHLSVRACMPNMLSGRALPVRKTFIHFEIYDRRLPSRAKSAPPILLTCFSEPAILLTCSAVPGPGHIVPNGESRKHKKRKSGKARKNATVSDDEVALRDFAAQAREEYWAIWAQHLLSRLRRVICHWDRMMRTVTRKHVEPVWHATLCRRAFTHVVQYAMPNPFDLIHFRSASVLRANKGLVEVWASEAIAQSTKVKSLIRAAKHFVGLARRREIMLRLPNRSMFVLPWEPDFPIGALQGRTLCECGVPPERQRLQCLGLVIHGDTLGQSHILPGDVIEVIELGH